MTAVTTDVAPATGYTWEGGPPAQPKPGYLTTEWWTTMLFNAIGAVLAFVALFNNHVLSQNVSAHVEQFRPFIGVAAILASGIATAYYARSRSHVKDGHAAALSMWAVMSQLAEAGVLSPQTPAAVQSILDGNIPLPVSGPSAPTGAAPAPTSTADSPPPPADPDVAVEPEPNTDVSPPEPPPSTGSESPWRGKGRRGG